MHVFACDGMGWAGRLRSQTQGRLGRHSTSCSSSARMARSPRMTVREGVRCSQAPSASSFRKPCESSRSIR